MSELHDLMASHLKKVFGLVESDSDFETEAAIYWFASDFHGGQSSALYEVLSESEFHPGPSHSSVRDEGGETEMLYRELVKTFGPKKEKRWTLKEAKKELNAIGMSISKRDGEYRVNYKGGKESTAYYTNDLGDAVSTGVEMSADAATRHNL